MNGYRELLRQKHICRNFHSTANFQFSEFPRQGLSEAGLRSVCLPPPCILVSLMSFPPYRSLERSLYPALAMKSGLKIVWSPEKFGNEIRKIQRTDLYPVSQHYVSFNKPRAVMWRIILDIRTFLSDMFPMPHYSEKLLFCETFVAKLPMYSFPH